MAKEYVPYSGPVVTRAEAKAAGLKLYFPGSFCPRAHRSQRKTLDGSCCGCRPVASPVPPLEERRKNRNAKTRERYAQNREKMIASSKAWQAANPEIGKAYRAATKEAAALRSKAWHQANPEKVRAKSQRWYAANPEQAPRWRKANPEAVRAIKQRRRAKEREAEGSHTADDIKRIGDAQKWRCHWCAKPTAKAYEIDHIQPLSRGGSNWPRNLCIACVPCNRSKHASDPVAFAQRLGLLL